MSKIDGPLETRGVPYRWVPHIDGEFVTDTLDGSLSKRTCRFKYPTNSSSLDHFCLKSESFKTSFFHCLKRRKGSGDIR